MKTEIWLVRHGQTEWNRLRRIQGTEDIELNEIGLQQAEQVAEYLKDAFFSVIVSSPLKRAFETAAIIQKRNKQQPPLVTDQDLVERDYGQISGLTYEEKAKLPKSEDYGVETLERLTQRAAGVLDRLEARYRGERLLVVSHGGFIKTLISSSMGATYERSKIVIDNCSVTKLAHRDGQWELIEQNIIEHLDGTLI
ncbi:putative phosphatase PhoE [Pullulanibacillus camelliae]|uniref:Putative phosphatase PhoE n=1 Tax=Pullulanibacillus camelliae TaxID=1707096 RepID=A0A8J2VPA2_9BACL|nr:histidine phosphatase family protein [Pullulanibacillus camelliae]GGE34268.1 putative phosphatase PhoE [Pullulanibacillus camelliae]